MCRFGLEYDFTKVLDFGLVRRGGGRPEGETRLTMDGFVGGTPAFLPPEMALGKREIDGRTDIYAIGCVAYWLVTGELVFESETPMEMAMKHVQEGPVAPSKKTELEIPKEFEMMTLRCLEKDPSERSQSTSELAELLRKCTIADSWNQSIAAEWWSKHLPKHLSSPGSDQGATR